MTDAELDDIERQARVNGNIRPSRVLALIGEMRRLQAGPVVPEDYGEIAFLPKPKYVVVEEDDGWHAYTGNMHGDFV